MRKATTNLLLRSFARTTFKPQIFPVQIRYYAEIVARDTPKAEEQFTKKKFEFLSDEVPAGKIFKTVSSLAKERIDLFIQQNKIEKSEQLLP